MLFWTTSNATSFSINNGIGSVTPVASGSVSTPAITSDTTFTGTVSNGSVTVTCPATVTVTTGGGGGTPPGGGGAYGPNVTLAALSRPGSQPLVYLYLSQIPYTGLELGPVGTFIYWTLLAVFALAAAYFLLFQVAPRVNRAASAFSFWVRGRAYEFSDGISKIVNAQTPAPAAPHAHAPAPRTAHMPLSSAHARHFSPHEGFKSFAHDGALSVEDIVKGLSRAHPEPVHIPQVAPAYQEEEVYEAAPVARRAEPVFEGASDVRGFAAALALGDRPAVFAGLRQHLRGGGRPEKFLTDVAVLFDEVYRARVDGIPARPDMMRLVERLDNPTLERLIGALASAIDASYTDGIVGAKLALARALASIGA